VGVHIQESNPISPAIKINCIERNRIKYTFDWKFTNVTITILPHAEAQSLSIVRISSY
jgi:hypothetical protein